MKGNVTQKTISVDLFGISLFFISLIISEKAVTGTVDRSIFPLFKRKVEYEKTEEKKNFHNR